MGIVYFRGFMMLYLYMLETFDQLNMQTKCKNDQIGKKITNL